MRKADVPYRAHMHSVWNSLADNLASQPDLYSAGATFHNTDTITDDAWEFTRLNVQRNLQSILTPDQLLQLPSLPHQLFYAKDRVHVRISPR